MLAVNRERFEELNQRRHIDPSLEPNCQWTFFVCRARDIHEYKSDSAIAKLALLQKLSKFAQRFKTNVGFSAPFGKVESLRVFSLL